MHDMSDWFALPLLTESPADYDVAFPWRQAGSEEGHCAQNSALLNTTQPHEQGVGAV